MLHMFVPVCMHVYGRGQKISDLLKLELPVNVSLLMWVLRIEIESTVSAVSFFNL